MEDIRGKKDLFGKPLLILRRATADNLVSTAQGETDESKPAVLIRDAPAVFIDGARISSRCRGRSACILGVLIGGRGLRDREMRVLSFICQSWTWIRNPQASA